MLPGFLSIAQQQPLHAKRIKWAISLESIATTGPDVNQAMEFVNELNVPVFSDAGPYFAETNADGWSGSDC